MAERYRDNNNEHDSYSCGSHPYALLFVSDCFSRMREYHRWEGNSRIF
jgi:hypothetical protein